MLQLWLVSYTQPLWLLLLLLSYPGTSQTHYMPGVLLQGILSTGFLLVGVLCVWQYSISSLFAAQFVYTSSRDCKVFSSGAWHLALSASIVNSPLCVLNCGPSYTRLLVCLLYASTASVSVRILNKVRLNREPCSTLLRTSPSWRVSSLLVYVIVACSVVSIIIATCMASFLVPEASNVPLCTRSYTDFRSNKAMYGRVGHFAMCPNIAVSASVHLPKHS